MKRRRWLDLLIGSSYDSSFFYWKEGCVIQLCIRCATAVVEVWNLLVGLSGTTLFVVRRSAYHKEYFLLL